VNVLNAFQQRAQSARHAAYVGRIEPVLVESAGAGGQAAGRTPQFKIVHFTGDGSLVGRTIEIEITGSGANSLLGRRLAGAASDSLTGSSAAPIL
jgi:tRNA-2-methylthio-N6-dimethylallyladenosine synthase